MWQTAMGSDASLSDADWRKFVGNARKHVDILTLISSCGLVEGGGPTDRKVASAAHIHRKVSSAASGGGRILPIMCEYGEGCRKEFCRQGHQDPFCSHHRTHCATDRQYGHRDDSTYCVSSLHANGAPSDSGVGFDIEAWIRKRRHHQGLFRGGFSPIPEGHISVICLMHQVLQLPEGHLRHEICSRITPKIQERIYSRERYEFHTLQEYWREWDTLERQYRYWIHLKQELRRGASPKPFEVVCPVTAEFSSDPWLLHPALFVSSVCNKSAPPPTPAALDIFQPVR